MQYGWLKVCGVAAAVALLGTTLVVAQPGRPGGGRPPGGGGGGQPGKPGGGGPSRPNPGRPNPGRPNPGPPPRPMPRPPAPRPPAFRPPQRPPRPVYNWGSGGNGWRLRQFYNNDMMRLNRARRYHFVAGGYFPRTYIGQFQPIPPNMMGYLPPVPPGYSMGYYDGYAVVYDPATMLILSALDLFRY